MTGPPRRAVDVREVPEAANPLRALAAAIVDIDRAQGLHDLAGALAHHARALAGAGRCGVVVPADGDLGTVTAISESPEPPDDTGPAADPTARRGLVVALTGHDGGALGRLTLSSPHHGGFDRDDEAIVGQIALIASSAIERRRHDEDAERGRRDLAESQRIASLGSWVAETGTFRVTWSDEVYRIFGVPAGGFAGTIEAFYALVHPDDRESVRESLERAIGGGRAYHVEHRIVRADGEVRTVLERAEAERDADGVVRRLLGTVLDVTRRRRTEDELRSQAARITALAAERRHLIAASLDAEERTRQRIADVLHDEVLQDLLAARQDLMQAASDPDALPALIARAERGIGVAVDGVRSVVGQLHPLTLTNGALRTALEAAGRAVAGRAGFALKTDIGADVGGDQNRLLLTLGREFLVNVEKHGAARTVTLRVHRRAGAIRLEVGDDGVGFTPDEGRDALRRGHIGLASARERVEELGGTLTISSRDGCGTRIVAIVPSSRETARGR